MPRKQDKARRPKKASRPPKNQIQQQLLQSSKMQEVRFTPEKPDIRFPLITRNKVYTVLQTYTLSASGATNAGSINFNLSFLPDAVSFQACFSQYRIAAVRVQFTPTLTQLLTALDYTPSLAPTGDSDLLKYDTLQIVPPNVISERVLSPKYSLDSAGETASLSAAWLSTTIDDVMWNSVRWSCTSGFVAFISVVLNLRMIA